MEIISRMLERPTIEPLYKETGLRLHLPNENRAEIIEKIYADSFDPEAVYVIKIEKRRRRRSLDANAYAWVLIGKLAEKLKTSPTAVYRQMITDAGVYAMAQVIPEAADRYRDAWESRGLGWVTEEAGQSPKGNIYLRCFYGTSVYDTAEMSRFLDLLIEECNEQGVDTMTPREVEELKKAWRD